MKFSIITPTLNASPFINKCVESVALQEGVDVEHLIVDGGSKDETTNIVVTLQKRFGHLGLIVAPGLNQSAAMNLGIDRSCGEIICILNADDWLQPGALDAARRAFTSNPKKNFVVGDLEIVTLNAGSWIMPATSSLHELLLFERYRWPLNPVCYFTTRSLQNRIGSYPCGEDLVMDYWFLLRARLKGRWITVNTVIGSFYKHDQNKSRDVTSIEARLASTKSDFLRSEAPVFWRIYSWLLTLAWTRIRSKRSHLE